MTQYIPKPDPEGINSSTEQSPVKDAVILLAGFLGVLGVCYIVLIGISDWALTKITVDQEISWLKKFDFIQNKTPNTPKEFNSFIERIKPHLPFALSVNVVCSSEINAGAFPGGKIILTTGLLENLKSENGLAFVLGHEIGHVLNRDHVRGIGRQLVFSIGGALLGFENISGLTMFNHTLARVYDREQEVNADLAGLDFVKKLYGHAWGADELFEVLEKKEGSLVRSLARLASTHPPSADRRAQLQLFQTGQAQSLELPSRPFKEWIPDFACPNF